MPDVTSGPAGVRRTVQRGRYYEDFQVGDLYRHHWGRTLTQGECQLFATGTMNAVPLYFNELFAKKLGHPQVPAHLAGQAGTGIHNRQTTSVLLAPGSQGQRPAVGHRFDGVADHLFQHQRQQ